MLTLQAKPRAAKGKQVKALRKNGIVPAVVYGGGQKAEAVEVSLGEFQKVWSEAGESSLIELDLDGQKNNVLIKDVQLDPLKDMPIHVDFYAVRMDKPIQAMVPIKFTGESAAVKNLGGSLVKVMHEIEVEALPANLPSELTVDVSGLANFGDRFLVKNLQLPEGVRVLANPEDIIVLVEEPKAAEEVPAEAPSVEDIEVIGKKGKAEEEAAEGKTAEEKPAEENKAGKAKEEKK